ncbi:Uncharacterised protein [Bordetella pertussis]|nr:Uncharacterised protein [Bordetella pertussis]
MGTQRDAVAIEHAGARLVERRRRDGVEFQVRRKPGESLCQGHGMSPCSVLSMRRHGAARPLS